MTLKKLHLRQAEFRALATTLLEDGNVLCFRAYGNSMSPFIGNGDTVHIKRAQSYRRGDVVFLRNKLVLLVHRIISVSEVGIMTRGDASACQDPGPVDHSAILGKVYKVSGTGYNYHLRPPFSHLMAITFFSQQLFKNPVIRKVGKLVSPLLG